MQKRIIPIATPILKEYPVKLVIFARITRAQLHRHVLGAFWMNKESGDLPGFGRYFTIGGGNLAGYTIPLDTHESGLDFEILRLVVMEVKGWTAGTMWRFQEVLEFLICLCVNVFSVGLAKEEKTSWRGLEKVHR